MRTTGIATITMIESTATPARARLLAVSNPRRDRTLGQYHCGVEALKELIGAPEDIRRFDIACIAALTDIPPDEFTAVRSHRPTVQHVFTSERCHKLVLWCWTRLQDQIHFHPEAASVIIAGSAKLCKKYHESIPLVDQGSMMAKLAKLSVAIAGRLFSTPDGEHLWVYKHHAEWVIRFLDECYSAKAFGYDVYSRAVQLTSTVQDPEEIKARIKALPFAQAFVQCILKNTLFDRQDVMDTSGLEYSESNALVGMLVRHGCIMRAGAKAYQKTEASLGLFRDLDEEFRTNPPAKPTPSKTQGTM